jgi:hypothetical protein
MLQIADRKAFTRGIVAESCRFEPDDGDGRSVRESSRSGPLGKCQRVFQMFFDRPRIEIGGKLPEKRIYAVA